MNSIKVSIIVPVYNVEQYLVKCLDSLVNQTLQEIEIICINDGSTDNSLEILNAYAQKDERVKVINKENEGQGVARNLGISLACGEFIGFVDPDDWVNLEMYEKMYTQAKNLNSEIVICNFIKYYEKTGEVWQSNFFNCAISLEHSKKIILPEGINLDKNVINETLLISPCYAWNRIYKTELLRKNDIKFDTIKCYEDCIFILRSHIEAESLSYIDYPFYQYRLRKTSTLRVYELRYKDLLQTYDKIIDYLDGNNLKEKFQLNLDFFVVMNTFWTYRNLNTQKYKKALKKEVRKYLSKENYKIFVDKCESGLKSKMKDILSIENRDEYKIVNIFGFKLKLPRYKFNKPIDLVYCWVDGNDVEWQKEKQYWQEKLGIPVPVTDAINPCRFIDNEELKYSLRSVAKNLPWINHIYIITNGQIPKWLDTTHPKITIINHNEIMPEEVLPVFSAYPIEACLANIPNLSNYFLYVNDDFFVYRHIAPDYFFDSKGNPIVRLRRRSKDKKRMKKELYLQNVIYSSELINEKFGKYYDYETTHNIDAYRKDYFLECKNLFKDEFRKTIYSKFSTQNLVQRTIVSFYMLSQKPCKLRVLRVYSKRHALENIYISLKNPILMDRSIQKHRKNLKLFCINDNETTKSEDRLSLKSYLEFLFPNRQIWEIDN